MLVCGQSFTVGITGTLTEVDLYLDSVEGTLDPGLYTTAGAPPTLLQSSSMPTYTVPNFYAFTFSLPVTAGDTLFFGLLMNADGEGFTYGRSFADPYSGGGLAFFAGAQPLFAYSDIDATFQTFVDPVQTPVPEPATLTLVGLGVIGTAARRWRLRKAR